MITDQNLLFALLEVVQPDLDPGPLCLGEVEVVAGEDEGVLALEAHEDADEARVLPAGDEGVLGVCHEEGAINEAETLAAEAVGAGL